MRDMERGVRALRIGPSPSNPFRLALARQPKPTDYKQHQSFERNEASLLKRPFTRPLRLPLSKPPQQGQHSRSALCQLRRSNSYAAFESWRVFVENTRASDSALRTCRNCDPAILRASIPLQARCRTFRINIAAQFRASCLPSEFARCPFAPRWL